MKTNHNNSDISVISEIKALLFHLCILYHYYCNPRVGHRALSALQLIISLLYHYYYIGRWSPHLRHTGLPRGGHSCMSDSLPAIALSVIHWQSKTRASEPELRPASELHARLEHGQDDVPGWWSGSGAGNCSC